MRTETTGIETETTGIESQASPVGQAASELPNVAVAHGAQAQDQAARLAAVVASSTDGILTKDLSGNITSWNDACRTIFGYDAEEMVGHSVKLLYPKEKEGQEDALLGEIRAGKSARIHEAERVRKDGVSIWVSVSSSPLRDASGHVVGAADIKRDITTRRKEDGQLRRLASVVIDSNDAITVQDLDGKFEAWNKGAERMYGYTEAEALQMNNSQLVPEAERARALDLVRQIRTGEAVDSVELQRVTKDGRILDVWLTITKLLDNQQKIVGFATTERDITKRRKVERSLRRLASVVLDYNDAITVQDLDGRITAWNKGAQAMYGYTEAEALEMNIRETVPEDRREQALDLLRQAETGQVVAALETQRRTKDGRILDVWLTTRKLLNETGKIVAIATTERDITQRKKDDANRGRLASVVADSNDAITIQNLDGKITAWNKGAQAMYGYTEAEALEMNIRDTVPEDRREQALDLLRQAETGQVVASLETQRVTKDGRILDVWLTTTKLLDETGKIVAIATTERDITKRRKEESSLRRLASVVLDSNDAITVQDLTGRFQAWNRGAERMYGYSEAEALGMNNSQLVPESERERALDLLRQIQNNGRPIVSVELQRVTKDGRILDVWLTITKLLDHQQNIVGIATTERDITQRKQQEADRGRLASVVADSNDAITIQNLDGQITAWNKGAHTMYGYTEAEALRMNVRDTVPEDRREQALDLLRQAETGQIVASLETQRVTKNGRILDVWLTTTKLLDESGKIVAIATTERDITKRKKEDGQLRRLASVVIDSNDAITVQGLDGKFEAWNKGAERMYGYTEAEALGTDADSLGMNNSQLVPESERARALDLVRQIRTGEPVDSVELQRVTKDGRILDVWLTTTKLLDESGKIVAIATTERDITQRKQQEASRGRLASVVADSNDAITIQGLDGRITAWNKGAHAMYGYSEAEALLMNIRDTVPEDRREQALDLLRQAETGEVVASLETQRVTKDGRILDVWLTTTKLLDESGKIVAIATTERDVTVLRSAEKERREAHERSQEMSRLQEVNRFKTQFINTAAHELWTPLMPLRTQVHLLLNNPALPPAPAQKKALIVMERNLERLGTLVEDLLTAARSQAGRQRIERESIDLSRVLSEATESYEDMANNRDISFTVARCAATPILADPKRISQVMANLLSNAFKFTPKGGRIAVGIEDGGAHVRVSVTDSGLGISQEDLPRLFNPFVQVHDTAQVAAPGSGLGLYICKEFIELHGGTIGADSPGNGEGATFWFTLPKMDMEPAATPEPGVPTSTWNQSSPNQSTERTPKENQS